MTSIPMEALTDISDRETVYQDVHDVIDDDDEPTGQPWRCVRMIPGLRTFGPGRAARPRTILQPCNMTRQVPAIDNEMCPTNNRERVDILRNEEEWQKVEKAVDQCGERPLRFLDGHPLALQQVIANRVGN